MGTHDEDQLPARFAGAFADIPELPDHLYGGVRQGIDRKTTVRRTAWAVAASLVVMVTAFSAAHRFGPQDAPLAASVADVSEELNTVDSYINSNVYKEDDDSYAYYEETLYQE
jgi:hypothetical protein